MNIIYNFIRKEQAYDIYKTAGHLKYYTNYERSDNIRTHTRDDFENYTIKEQAALRFYINILITEHSLMNFFPIDRIDFMKSKSGKDWDFPYTFISGEHNVIMLTEIGLQKILSGTGFKNRYLLETLLHEIIHLHQKRNNDSYVSYYERIYGFKQITLDNYDNNVAEMITNPDGYYVNGKIWAIKIDDNYYFPYLEISMKERLRKINYINNRWLLSNIFADDGINAKYNAMFKVESQRYHPNEIFARINAKKIIFA